MNAADRLYEDRAARQRESDRSANLPTLSTKIITTPISDQFEQLKNGLQQAVEPHLKIAGDGESDTSVQPVRGMSFSELMQERMAELDADREREEIAAMERRREFKKSFNEIFGGEVEAG